jgi:antitoxin CptB
MREVTHLKWHCRRGMRELDLLLVTYCEQFYATAAVTEQQTFIDLLELQDDLIYDYLFGEKPPDTVAMAALVSKIKTVLQTA